jgi:hypothetical protein
MTEWLTILRQPVPITWNLRLPETSPAKHAYPVSQHDAGFIC